VQDYKVNFNLIKLPISNYLCLIVYLRASIWTHIQY